MDVVQVLSALGSVALIVGIGIGLVQLHGLRTQRQEELVIRAYAPFLDTALTRAYWRVHTWDFESFATFQTRASVDDWTALDQVATYFEMMGSSTSAASPSSTCSMTFSRVRYSSPGANSGPSSRAIARRRTCRTMRSGSSTWPTRSTSG